MQGHRLPQERLYEPRPAPPNSTARGPDDDASHLTFDLDTASWMWPFADLDAASVWADAPDPALAHSFPARFAAAVCPDAQTQSLSQDYSDPSFDPQLHARRLALRESQPGPARNETPIPASSPSWDLPSLHDRHSFYADMEAARFHVPSTVAYAPTHGTHASTHHPGSANPASLAPAWMAPTNERHEPLAQHPVRQPIGQYSTVTVLPPRAAPSAPASQPSRPSLAYPVKEEPGSSSTPVGPIRSKKRIRNPRQPGGGAQAESATALWKGRSGPLDESTREKSRSLRQYGACWRCRKYRKPCSNGPEICETCVTSGFRVWPSELGCRRGNLDSHVDVFLPTNAEFVFQSSPLGHNKRHPWRKLLDPSTINAARNAAALTTEDKRWGMLIHKALGTRIFGLEFVELFEIVARYQQTTATEHPALDAACSMLDSTTDFYYTFVHIDGDETLMHDPMRTVRTIRKSFSRALRMILNGCLSGRAKEWLPCLLAGCMLAAAIVCFTDAACQIPIEVRQAVWPDLGAMVQSIKGSLYMTVVHLLTALAKGGKPLQMSCWRMEEETDPTTSEVKYKRNDHGLKLMANDEPSFDGVRALQEWLGRHGSVVTIGRVWSSSTPFSQAQIPAIAIMGALFDA